MGTWLKSVIQQTDHRDDVAAAVPDRTAVGKVQNTGSVPNRPQAPMAKAMTVNVGLLVSVEAAIPTAAIASETAVWTLRSPRLSER